MTAAATLIDQTDRSVPRRLASPERWGAAGGLIFVAILVVQNVLRANAPSFDATPATVTAYFTHHRAAALIPLGLFPLGMLAMFAFVAVLWARADTAQGRRWANLGALGATAIAALFAAVNITEIVLTARAKQLAPSPAVVQALWATHAAAFGLDLAAIAVALIGLSRTATATGLIRPWVATVALPGATCLLTASVFTVGLVNGGPWLALALIGFVVWGVFVVTASLALLRQPSHPIP